MQASFEPLDLGAFTTELASVFRLVATPLLVPVLTISGLSGITSVSEPGI